MVSTMSASGYRGEDPRDQQTPNAIFPDGRRGNEDRVGDRTRPRTIAGQLAIVQLRIRRDEACGLSVLADGRYAISGRPERSAPGLTLLNRHDERVA